MPEMPEHPLYAEVQPAEDEKLTQRQEEINRQRRQLQDSVFMGQLSASLQSEKCTPAEWAELVRGYSFEPVPNAQQQGTEQWRVDLTKFVEQKKQAQQVLTLLQKMKAEGLQEFTFSNEKKVTLAEVQEAAKRQLALFISTQNTFISRYSPNSQKIELPTYLAEYVPLSPDLKRLASMTEAMLVTQFDVRDTMQIKERHDMVLNEANEILQITLHKNLRVADIVTTCLDVNGNVITDNAVYLQLLQNWNIHSAQNENSQIEQIDALKMIVGFLHKHKSALVAFATEKGQPDWTQLRLHSALETATRYDLIHELQDSFASVTHDMIEGDYAHALDTVLDEVNEPVPSEVMDTLLFDRFRSDPMFHELTDDQLREKVHVVYLEMSSDSRSLRNIVKELNDPNSRVTDIYKRKIITTIIDTVASADNVAVLNNSLLIPKNSDKDHHKKANEIWTSLLSKDSDTLRGKDAAQLFFTLQSAESPNGLKMPNLVLGLQAITMLSIEKQNSDIARQLKMDVLNRMYATMKHTLFSLIYRSDPITAIEEEVDKLDLTNEQKTELLNTYKYLIQRTEDEVRENYKNFRELPVELQVYILWPYILSALGAGSIGALVLRMKANNDYEKGRKLARQLSYDVRSLDALQNELQTGVISTNEHSTKVEAITSKWKMNEAQLRDTNQKLQNLIDEHNRAKRWFNVLERHSDRRSMNEIRRSVSLANNSDVDPELEQQLTMIEQDINTLEANSVLTTTLAKIGDSNISAQERVQALQELQQTAGLTFEASALQRIETAINTNTSIDLVVDVTANTRTINVKK